MTKIKRRIKRFAVRMERRIAPKDSIIVARTTTGVLSKSELREVLNSIRQAQRVGKLPALSYNYGTLSLIPSFFGAETGRLYLRPKSTGLLAGAIVKVRAVLRQKYGDKYKVKFGVGR